MKFFKNKLAVTVMILSVAFLVIIAVTAGRQNQQNGTAKSKSLFESSIGAVFNPIQRVVYNLVNNVEETFSFVFEVSKVKAENEQLKARNDELENELIDYKSIKGENDRLREIVNYKNANEDYKYITCNIINKSGGNYLDEFAINRGSDDGIAKNMVVICSGGLVGQVTSVANNWSIVQSLASENIAVSASTEQYTGVIKGYKGSSGNNMMAKLYFLPLDAVVKEGEEVVTSGLGGIYPKGIRIGKVESIEQDKAKLQVNAIVRPYVNYNKLDEVTVVIPKNPRDIKY